MSERKLTLAGGLSVTYALKVSARRRTVGLQVDERGLTVHIPTRMPQHALESLLRNKSDWIARKLAKWQHKPAAIVWRDGVRLRHLGQSVQLCLRRDARSRAVEFDGGRLHLAVTDPDDVHTVQRKVIQWYAKQARSDYARRIELLAAKLGVSTPPLFLSSARTRWGSCNSKGEIRLSWRLIQAPPHIIHYVIAHELAHLKEMNHSPQFWAWVEKLCPEYQIARQELKALSAHLHLV
jgi:predicted metal-dependent hydrolase